MQTLPRKRVRANPAERRKQILSEAVHLIGKHGFYGFNLRELAERCQLSGGGLLHHFDSKEALLIAVLEDRDARGAEDIHSRFGLTDEESRGARVTLSKVRDILHQTAALNSVQPELVRLYVTLQAEALNPDHPAHDYFIARQRSVVEAYSALVAPHVRDPASLGVQLVATIQGLEHAWLLSDGRIDLVAEWDRAVDRLLPAPAID